MNFLRGQHPEGAIRYLPIVHAITVLDQTLGHSATILEIGAGEWGIVPYLGRAVDAVDPGIKHPFTKDLHLKKGSALQILCDDKSYDVVLSSDMLEHLPNEDRQKAVFEMVRVARHLVVIAVPCGTNSRKHDMQMDLLYQFWRKKHEPSMEEHARYRLPDGEDVLEMIHAALAQNGRKGSITKEKNLNIGMRQFLIQWWIFPWRWSYYFYLKGLLLIVPFRRFLNFGHCYRVIFTVRLEQ
ncbi:MAG: methyltransferase domain-containing protein [bacterium]|nr:methyltransferase domain-containing protein [bacterium]